MQTIYKTNFSFIGQTGLYHGKVRDVYSIGDKYLVMIASDRISAFDVILPRPIPYKGQVLNQTALHFLEATSDICPNWMLSSPDPNVMLGLKCKPFKIEMVVRGYLSGHAWRLYKSGQRIICGVQMPEGLHESDPFPEPIITPTTKADAGHDADISKDEIIKQGLAGKNEYEQLENLTLSLYARGHQMAQTKGLILVDTKYEFGTIGDKIYLMDEIHTPDSSRYFYSEGYLQRQSAGEPQKQLSKEFLRQWLIDNGFQGLPGQSIPEMTDDIVREVSDRYIELYETVTGNQFVPAMAGDINKRIEDHVTSALKQLA